MTREQAIITALEIDKKYLEDVEIKRSEKGQDKGHLRWMVLQMMSESEMSINKTMRWLGYIQGVLVAQGHASLDEMKEISRKNSHEALSN